MGNYMKKLLVIIAVTFGAITNTTLGAYKYWLKNKTNGTTYFKIFDADNQKFAYGVNAYETHFAQTDSKVVHVAVAYTNERGLDVLKAQHERGLQLRGQKLSSFNRQNGVESGMFTFAVKKGVTFTKI